MTNRPDRDRIAPGRFVICHWSFVIFQEIGDFARDPEDWVMRH